MRKNKKYIPAVLLAVILLLLPAGCQRSQSSQDSQTGGDIQTGGGDTEITASQAPGSQYDAESAAQEAYDRLLSFLGGDPGERSLYRDPKGEAWRPYYGGAWINGEKKLVVALTEDSEEIREKFREVLDYDGVVFQKVLYSYDSLYCLYENMIQKQQEEAFQSLSSYGINVQENRLEVELIGEEEQLRQDFLAWLQPDAEDMVQISLGEYVWVIRDQEDQELMDLTLLLQNGLLAGFRLTRLGDVEGARREAMDLSPEVKADIEQYMQHKADTEYTVIKLDKQVVEEGDLAMISYRSYTKTRFLDRKSVELPVQCSGEQHPGLEAIMASVTPGRRVGETYTIEYTNAPFDIDETVFCDITILYIYRAEACELNDAFVQTFTEYSSVEEWRAALYREESLRMMVPEAWKRVLEKLLPACEFELDEAGIKEKASDAEKAGKAIREYLLVEAIARHYGIEISEAELQAYIKKQELSPKGLTGSALEACRWRALREKVIEKMTEGR